MNKRPLSVTIIGCIYILAGVVGLAYHLTDFRTRHPFQYDVTGIALLRLIAILSGAFMLRGRNWARWLAIAWIAFHTAVSTMHSMPEMIMHLLLLALFAWFLFRPTATDYFRWERTESEPMPR